MKKHINNLRDFRERRNVLASAHRVFVCGKGSGAAAEMKHVRLSKVGSLAAD